MNKFNTFLNKFNTFTDLIWRSISVCFLRRLVFIVCAIGVTARQAACETPLVPDSIFSGKSLFPKLPIHVSQIPHSDYRKCSMPNC